MAFPTRRAVNQHFWPEDVRNLAMSPADEEVQAPAAALPVSLSTNPRDLTEFSRHLPSDGRGAVMLPLVRSRSRDNWISTTSPVSHHDQGFHVNAPSKHLEVSFDPVFLVVGVLPRFGRTYDEVQSRCSQLPPKNRRANGSVMSKKHHPQRYGFACSAKKRAIAFGR